MDHMDPAKVIAILSRAFPGEEFRAHPHHPGYYLSDGGQALTTWPKHPRGNDTEIIARADVAVRRLYEHDVNGYRQVAVRGRSKVAVHTLILETFVGPRPEGMEACHFDGDRANNRLANLRWDTPAGNAADKGRHGTDTRGETNGGAKLTPDSIRLAFNLAREGLGRREIAARIGATPSHVWLILRAKTWKHITTDLRAQL